jgi:hypothetical protein
MMGISVLIEGDDGLMEISVFREMKGISVFRRLMAISVFKDYINYIPTVIHFENGYYESSGPLCITIMTK